MNSLPIDLTYKLLENKGELLYLSEYGSTLYGTNTPDSDIDYRGIFLPNKQNQLLGIKCEEVNYTTGNSQSKNSSTDVDIKLMSLQKFIKLCSQGDTNALDLLFSMPCDHVSKFKSTEHIMYLYTNRQNLIDVKNMKAFIGYAIAQAKKYGIKGSRLGVIKDIKNYLGALPKQYDEYPLSTKVGTILHCFGDESYCFHKTLVDKETDKELDYLCVCGAMHQYNVLIKEFKTRINQVYEKYGERAKLAEENQGIDWKALSHAIRCIEQCKELLTTGNITFPLTNSKYIKEIKYGQLSFNQVEKIMVDGLDVCRQLQDNCSLNFKYDSSLWNEYILNMYEEER